MDVSSGAVTPLRVGEALKPAEVPVSSVGFWAPGEIVFSAGQGLIWLAHRRFNVMLEALYTRIDVDLPSGARTSEALVLNPGVRAAIDLAGGLEIVPGTRSLKNSRSPSSAIRGVSSRPVTSVSMAPPARGIRATPPLACCDTPAIETYTSEASTRGSIQRSTDPQ